MRKLRLIIYLLNFLLGVYASRLDDVKILQENYQLKLSKNSQQSKFGYDVDICGRHIVVGSPRVYLGRNRHPGSAAIFTFNGTAWNNGLVLKPPRLSGAKITDGFGISVGIGNLFAVVSSPYEYHDRDNSGSVYVYKLQKNQNWVLDGRIKSENRGFRFGHTVALDRDVVAVGSPLLANKDSSSEGSVFVFVNTRDGWVEQTRLQPTTSTDVIAVKYFGATIAMHLDRIVVHAFQLERNREYSSLVFVYKYSGSKWYMEALIKPELSEDVGRLYPNLAHSVSRNKRRVSLDINQDHIVIGAPHESGFSGAAFVYKRTGHEWKFTLKLQPRKTWMFGDSVSVDRDLIAVGTVSSSTTERPSSNIYIYRIVDGEWRLEEILAASDGGRNVGNLDARVVVNNGNVIAGSFNKRDQLESGNGPVYFYRLPYEKDNIDC